MQGTLSPQSSRPPFWRDERILGLLGQLLVLAIFVGVIVFAGVNLVSARERQNIPISFGFLDSTASFDIPNPPIEYSRNSTYARAILVGLINTLRVAVLGIVLSTALGILIGVMRLSSNFLVKRIAGIYIDTFRNIPSLLILIFFYQAIFLQLPRARDALMLPGGVVVSLRGFAMPWGVPTESWPTYQLVLLGALMAAVLVAVGFSIYGQRTGRTPFVTGWFLLTFVAITAVGWFVLPQPLTLTVPEPEGLGVTGGISLSIEFMAVLLGLTIYTAAFIAETVRAGIQSVAKGQREASQALGLNPWQTLRLVIFPQALRVIIPPLTSQYLNLTKNTSLAIAVGYSDLFQITGFTIQNQTGRAIEVFAIVMAIYLVFSLTTSLIMNIYNRATRLVER